MEYYTAKEVKELFHINTVTLSRWKRQGAIPYIKLNDRKFLYDKAKINEMLNNTQQEQKQLKQNVIYCRVSNTKQKNDLLKQEQLLTDFCNAQGIIVDNKYSEIASGMNENRNEFNKLLQDVINEKIAKVFITYKDRLTRFGFSYFQNIFKQHGCEIIVLNNKINEETFEQELTQDIIEIINHFSMKLYSNRRKTFKEAMKVLEQE